MPDPIRSASTPAPYPDPADAEPLMCVDPDENTSATQSPASASSADGPLMSLPPEEPNASLRSEAPPVPSEGTRALTAKFSKPSPAAAAATPAPSNGNNHAERLQQTSPGWFQFDHGVTESGDRFETAALFAGRDPNTGIVAEIGSASAQDGKQFETQLSAFRMGVTSDDGLSSLMLEGPTVHMSAGTYNKDGSEGGNGSVSATLLSLEGTLNVRGSSLSFGASVGVNGDSSSGTRDSDGDGVEETCTRLGAEVFTVGLCIEDPAGWGR